MQALRQNKKLKIIILLLCICVVAFSAFSIAYEFQEANHVCTGSQCVICNHLHQLTALGRELWYALLAAGVSTAVLLIFWKCAADFRAFPHIATPVQLKVKLNN